MEVDDDGDLGNIWTVLLAGKIFLGSFGPGFARGGDSRAAAGTDIGRVDSAREMLERLIAWKVTTEEDVRGLVGTVR